MIRGEFVRGDGLILPNNITSSGVQEILRRALRGTAASQLYVGLCQAVYAPDMTTASIVEPTIGVNGYARIALSQSAGAWPNEGTTDGEYYIESSGFVWAATGVGFDQGITRPFICYQAAGASPIFSLGAPLASPLMIIPATPLAERTFKYRIYGR